MYECPNCAANLKFHIKKQMLFCEACETTMDPYDFHKKRDAQESRLPESSAGSKHDDQLQEIKFYKTTLFTCPQCGGELITEDDTVATFCSYCGGSTILDSRISKEQAPRYIIPFQKDKEDCKKAYKRMMRYAHFVPKGFKDAEHIERFRPIYMPFWLYTFKHNGSVKLLDSRKTPQRERLKAEYDGLFYDASSTFSDDLTDAIWPYHLEEKKKFTPSFLSGFYADAGDIHQDLYVEEAREMVTEDTLHRIRKDPDHFRDWAYGWKLRPVEESLDFKAEKKDLAMLPVWFLAYRKKDRVAYAVVNGQTGKIAADMPIAVHKYLLSSLFWAIPIFLLLYSFWNMQPTSLLVVSALLSFVCSVVSNMQLSYLIIRDNKEKDRGFMEKQRARRPLEDKKFTVTIPSKLLGVILLILMPIWPLYIMSPVFWFSENYIENEVLEFVLALVVILLILPSYMLLMWGVDRFLNNRRLSWRVKMEQFMYGRKKLPYLIKPFVGVGIAVVLLCLRPVSEVWYYAGALACMLLTGLTFVNIIRYHNRLTTRKLPQLNRRGGDENA